MSILGGGGHTTEGTYNFLRARRTGFYSWTMRNERVPRYDVDIFWSEEGTEAPEPGTRRHFPE